MKTSTTRSRRLRNTHQQDEKHQEPFFSRSSEHEHLPFFNTQPAGSGQAVQTKLTIGKADDRYEQEADQVANKVVAKSGQSMGLQQASGTVQRAALTAPLEDEKPGTAEARMEKDKLVQEKAQTVDEQQEVEEIQTKKEEEEVQTKKEEEELQTKREEEEQVQAKGEKPNAVNPEVSEKIKNSAGAGQPLTGEILTEMEQVFGADFSGVNIHTDADAVQMNKKLHSQAFTRGQDIFFNEGKYRPETSEGKRLLAHELAHVVQQCGQKPGNKQK